MKLRRLRPVVLGVITSSWDRRGALVAILLLYVYCLDCLPMFLLLLVCGSPVSITISFVSLLPWFFGVFLSIDIKTGFCLYITIKTALSSSRCRICSVISSISMALDSRSKQIVRKARSSYTDVIKIIPTFVLYLLLWRRGYSNWVESRVRWSLGCLSQWLCRYEGFLEDRWQIPA